MSQSKTKMIHARSLKELITLPRRVSQHDTMPGVVAPLFHGKIRTDDNGRRKSVADQEGDVHVACTVEVPPVAEAVEVPMNPKKRQCRSPL